MNEYTIHPHEATVAKIVRWQDTFAFVVYDGEGDEFASGAAGDPVVVSDMLQEYLATEWSHRPPTCPWRVTETGVNWKSCTLQYNHEGPHQYDGPESGTRPAFYGATARDTAGSLLRIPGYDPRATDERP